MTRRAALVLLALAALVAAAAAADIRKMVRESKQQSLQAPNLGKGLSSSKPLKEPQTGQKQLSTGGGGPKATTDTGGKQQQKQQLAGSGGGGSKQPASGKGTLPGGGIVEGSGAADLAALDEPASLAHLPSGAAVAEAKSKALLEMLGPDMPLHAVARDISFIGFGLERNDDGSEKESNARPAVLVGVHDESKRDSVLAAARTAVSDDNMLVQAFAVKFEPFPELPERTQNLAMLETETEIEADIGAGSWNARDRPIRGGASLSRCAAGTAGTLGGFLTKAGSPGIRYGVTNMHVLGVPPAYTLPPVGQRRICQPGRFDGGRAPLAAFGQFKAGFFNYFNANGNIDISVFKVDRGGSNLGQTRCSLRADHLGGPYAIVGVANIAVGNVVHKFGRTTEHTRSTVALTGAVVIAGTARGNMIAINLANTLGAARTAGAGIAVPGNPFGFSGDSGSFYLRPAPGAANRFNVVGLNAGRATVGGVRYVVGYTIGHVLGTINANGLTAGSIPAGDLPLTVCTSNLANL